jgi:hypothetical protein
MSKNNGGPAFPIPGLQDDADFNGMTLRDYFAAKALQGMCADPTTAGTAGKDIVAECYDLADAMLEARKA